MLRRERWLFSSGSQSCMCFRSGVGRCFSLAMFFARSNVCPRTGLPISVEMVPSIVAEDGIALRVYLLTRGVLQNAAGASANSLWQGGIDIRILWHNGCQSEFEE